MPENLIGFPYIILPKLWAIRTVKWSKTSGLFFLCFVVVKYVVVVVVCYFFFYYSLPGVAL